MTAASPPPSWWSRGLQLAGFLGGLIGMANEAFLVGEPRTLLVAAYLAMMGIPAGILADRRLRSPFGPPDPEPPAELAPAPPDEPSTP